MTRNEMMAKKMGWTISDYIDGGYDISDIGKNDAAGHWLAHLLIKRMVGDGWDIDVCWSANTNEIMCVATKCDNGGYIKHRVRETDFPAAVVELFCRVYAIPDGE